MKIKMFFKRLIYEIRLGLYEWANKEVEYDYSRKYLAPITIYSIVANVISLLLMFASIAITIALKGEAGEYLGAIGLSSLLFALYGLYAALNTFFYEDANKNFAYGSIICSIIIYIIWIILLH